MALVPGAWVLRQQLETDVRLIVPELRGVGSADRRGPFTPFRLADDLAAILAAIPARRRIIWGRRLGGAIALVAAGDSPKLVDGLILENVFPQSGLASLLTAMHGQRGSPDAVEAGVRVVVGHLVEQATEGADAAFRDRLTAALIEGASATTWLDSLESAVNFLADPGLYRPYLDVEQPLLILRSDWAQESEGAFADLVRRGGAATVRRHPRGSAVQSPSSGWAVIESVRTWLAQMVADEPLQPSC